MENSNEHNNRITCALCPRKCKLSVGQEGFCHVRRNTGTLIEHDSYGHITPLSIDPIEKKPLFHFMPSAKTLSFGTYGCNMGCKFCQNYHITKTKNDPHDLPHYTPEQIVKIALKYRCQCIAFTYNDPVIFYEFTTDVARLAKQASIHTIAVSAGYINSPYKQVLFSNMDAVNIDLKSIRPDFYKKNCAADINVVLETIKYIKDETNAWLEITNLIIEGENDSDEEIKFLCNWIVQNLGTYVPLHFSTFHPAYKMLNKCPTLPNKVFRAYEIAKQTGINYVYCGNVTDKKYTATYCKNCGSILIERDLYKITKYNLDDYACCKNCKTKCEGVFR